MSTAAEILNLARSRANEGTPYAGAVTPREAYELLQLDPAVKLIDVRTNAERDWVGRVDIADTQHGAVQWATYGHRKEIGGWCKAGLPWLGA